MVLSDRRFSRALAQQRDPSRTVPAPDSRLQLLAHLDPPEHTPFRKVFNSAFTAARAQQYKPLMEEIISSRLDQLASGKMHGDLVGEVFEPFSLQLVSDVMGLPAEGRDDLRVWSIAQHRTSISRQDFERDTDMVTSYFDRIVESRRLEASADIISEALCVRDTQGLEVTDSDVAAMAAGLFVTGVHALADQLSLSSYLLFREPRKMTEFSGGQEFDSRYVDELLRCTPIIQGPLRARCVVEDLELGGVHLRGGDLVLPLISAANYDMEIFPDPLRLDFNRHKRPTLTFGFGVHFCQAAQFSRVAVAVVLAAMHNRFPGMRLAIPHLHLSLSQGKRIRSLEKIPVIW
ncbi:cytochrome P450 [Streptomyces sp. MS2.AVA.5]|uniref:Cytochrome P450 n=1 Tax=Streptomyces achmelvichensis TaxID=3134111 RepID=A0ACC6PL57_9ACTN